MHVRVELSSGSFSAVNISRRCVAYVADVTINPYFNDLASYHVRITWLSHELQLPYKVLVGYTLPAFQSVHMPREIGSTMGSKSSKETIIERVYVESDESKKAVAVQQLDQQVERLKSEVLSIEPSITENVMQTVNMKQDVLLLQYSQLQDKATITKNIEEVFGGFPLMNFLVDTATRMISAMNATKELTEIMRWQQQKMVKRVGSKVYGMEAHYKVKILEETTGNMLSRSKETVVLIAYKCMAHSMDLDPRTIPDEEEHNQITFWLWPVKLNAQRLAAPTRTYPAHTQG